MNLILYSMFVFGGFFLVWKELAKKRSNSLYVIPLVLLFLFTLCSRIGHDQDYNDLNAYVSYFLNDDDKYFEPGYLVFTSIIKGVFGYSPFALVFFVGLFDVGFLFLAYRLLTNRRNASVAVDPNKRKYSFSNTIKRWIVSGRLVVRRRIRKRKRTVPGRRFVVRRRISRTRRGLPTRGSLYGFLPLFFVYALYWGTSFGCEVIRLGMALCVLFCAMAAVISNRPWLALVFFPLAFTFQYTSLGLIVAVLFFLFFKEPKTGTLWTILVLGMVIDQLFVWGIFSTSLSGYLLDKVLSTGDAFTHYGAYSGMDSSFSARSLQYWAYHLFGALMLFGNMADRRYNRAVTIYIMGLFAGTLLNGSIFSMRFQWLYLPVIVFVLYYFLQDFHFSFKTKLSVVSFYSLIEVVMAVRYLGVYV